jgi:hypothetical protein
MQIRASLGILALFCAAGCTELPDVDRLRCGNGLVEQQVDEDCDGLAAGSPYACGSIGGPEACRFVCHETDCPAGWACGADEICRAPTGDFRRGDVVAMPGDVLSVGDLDGDGALDALSLSENELILAFGSEGSFGDVRRLRTPPMETVPIVTDIDDDGHADVVFVSEGSLTVLRGQDSRALAPILVPSRTDAPSASGLTSIRIDATGETVVLMRPMGQATDLQLADRPLDASAVGEALGGGRLNPPIVGQLDGDVLSAQEMVLSRIGATRAVVARIECAPDCVVRVLDALDLPDRMRLGPNTPLLGDLNADGHPDVLATSTQADQPVALVAWGSAEGLSPLVVAPEFALAAGCNDCGPISGFSAVERLADVVGDARPDIITGLGVYEIAGPSDTPELILRYDLTEPLNVIESVDVDGNGELDVVGYGAGQLVYLLSDGQRFTRISSPFEDGAEPVFGDFDGDGRIDLARWDTDGQIEIAFGGPEGLPVDPVVVGRFEVDALEMVATQQRRPYSSVLDRPDELAIVAGNEYTVLYGNSGRLPTVFMSIESIEAERTSPTVLLAAGRLMGDAHQIVTYLAGRNAAEAYIADSSALAVEPFTPVPVGCQNSGGLDHFTQVVDWAGDGHDQLVLIESRQAMPTAETTWNAQRLRFDDTGGECVWTSSVTSANEPSVLLADDIDQDAVPDIMALLSPRRTPIPELGNVGARLALWRGADDASTPATQHVVQPQATAATTLKLAEIPTVLTFGNGRAWSLAWNGTDFDVFDRFQVPRDVRAAAAADLTGDGIDDLLLKTDSGLVVYRQTTCSARQAWQGECTRPALP